MHALDKRQIRRSEKKLQWAESGWAKVHRRGGGVCSPWAKARLDLEEAGRPRRSALGLAWPVWPTHGGGRGWRSPSSSARCRGRNRRGGGYRRCRTTTRRGRAPARSGMDGSGLGAPDLAGVRTRTAGDQALGAHGGLLRGRERAGEKRKEKGKGERGDRAAA